MIKMKDIKSYMILNNGVKMPLLGFGTYKAENGDKLINAIKECSKNWISSYRYSFFLW